MVFFVDDLSETFENVESTPKKPKDFRDFVKSLVLLVVIPILGKVTSNPLIRNVRVCDMVTCQQLFSV